MDGADGGTRVMTELCRDCGAVYQVTIRRMPVRTQDWYHCAVCGRLMGEWDSISLPSYRFVRLGPTFPPRKPR